MTYSYIRVSSNQQTIEHQKNEIKRYCDLNSLTIDDSIQIEISSRKDERKRKITKLLDLLSSGDMLIVTELSRLGRNTGEVITLIDTLIKKDVEVRILKQNLFIKQHDTMTKMLVTMLSMFAEFERDIISQRTKEALQGLKDNGVKLGKKVGTIQKSKYDKDVDRIIELSNLGLSYQKITIQIGYGSQSSLHTYLKKRGLINLGMRKTTEEYIKIDYKLNISTILDKKYFYLVKEHKKEIKLKLEELIQSNKKSLVFKDIKDEEYKNLKYLLRVGKKGVITMINDDDVTSILNKTAQNSMQNLNTKNLNFSGINFNEHSNNDIEEDDNEFGLANIL